MSQFMVRWLKLSLVVIVGCGFLAMMIYAFLNREEIRSSEIEPPLIAAPTEPLKRRPDQPGGMQIPNRDKLVFDLLDSNNTSLGATGVAVPGLSPTVEVTGAGFATVSDSVAAVEAVGMTVEAVTPTHAGMTPATVTVATPTAVVPAPKPVVAVAPKEEPKVAESKPVEAKPAVKEVEKPVEKTAAVKGGKWGVQVAAVNSTADGNAMTAKLAKELAPLKGLSPRVSAAPGGKKYRVQFVGLKDREAAAAVCSKLAGKQPCFPVNLQ